MTGDVISSGTPAHTPHPTPPPAPYEHRNVILNGVDPSKKTIPVGKTIHTLTEHTTLCIDALSTIYNNPHKRIFIRNGHLSQLVFDENDRIKINTMNRDGVRNTLDRCINFVDYQKTSGSSETFVTIKARPPQDVCENILAAPDLHEFFPPLKSITESPYITRDGVVVTKPGYCNETGIYFNASGEYRELDIPEHPSEEDVKKASSHLEELFSDFNFETESCRQNALAALITSVLRPTIRGCVPLYLVDKPQMGVGGSLVCDMIVRISTGRPLQPSSAPEHNDTAEWEKKIISILNSGETVTCFDNIETNFHNATLSAVITAESYSGRMLGYTNHTTFDNRVFWMGNGINITIGGDMPRRIFTSRLVTDSSRPYQRTGFRISNIKKHTIDHRFEYIRDVLVIAKAYHNAHYPLPVWDEIDGQKHTIPIMGSFESWRDYVGGIMVFIGKKDFLGNVEALLQACESQSSGEEELLEHLKEKYEDREFTAKSALNDLDIDDFLPDFISSTTSTTAKAKKLGWYFSKINGRVFPNGLRLKFSRETRRVKTYTIRSTV